MQEQSTLIQDKIRQLVTKKKWDEAEEMLEEQPKTKQLIKVLVELYGKISFEDEQEYERFLKILVKQIDYCIDYEIYHFPITTIITQIISLSSLKYGLIIIRGLITQIQSNHLGKFMVLSNLYLFSGLFFGSAFDDLLDFYEQFKKCSKLVSQEINIHQNQGNLDINKIVLCSLTHLLSNILKENKIINESKIGGVILFYSRLCKDLNNLISSKQQYQAVDNEQVGISISNTLLLFLQQQKIDVTKEPLPLLFVKRIIKWDKTMNLQSYQSFTLSNKSFIRMLLLMVIRQLSDDLNTMPEMTHADCLFIGQSIISICGYLSQQTQNDNYQFLNLNSSKIEQFVEKVNIFLGAINPKQPIFKILTQKFVPLNFIPRQFREKLLSKLIIKHKNQSFKCHLISQYRKLLTFKTPKDTWIRSTSILVRELSNLQPKASVDYIGHILSFAYYWKEVGNKLLQNQQTARNIYIDVNGSQAVFRQKLWNLRKGLEDRLKLLSIQKNQQQRNEISVCLFRIEELLMIG